MKHIRWSQNIFFDLLSNAEMIIYIAIWLRVFFSKFINETIVLKIQMLYLDLKP